MASVINFYDSLLGTKTINGTWSFVSGPATFPAAPASYNDDVDFDTFDYGTYVYSYEVTNSGCTDTSLLTIEWSESDLPSNNNCNTAKLLQYSNGSTLSIINQTNIGDCSLNLGSPTDSGIVEPASWSSVTSYTGDLWFRCNVVLDGGSNVNFKFSVDGSPYSNGIQTPMIAVYNGDCGTLSLLDDQVGFGSQYIESSVLSTIGAADTYYLRVASESAGRFTVSVEGNI